MGRVARYKKIKSCDPYSKQNSRGRKPTTLSGERVWGLTEDDRTVKVKKRSRTAERLRAQKQQRRDKRKRKPDEEDNHDDDNVSTKKSNKGFDLPPTEGDDFDLKDLVSLKAGSNKNIKRQKTVEEEVAEDELKNASASVTVGSAAASTTTATAEAAAAAARLEMQQEVKVNRLLQLDTQLEKRAQQQQQDSSASALNRLPGESKNAYGRRMKEETRKLLKRNVQALANPDKRQRKKDFLNAKKKNGKNSKGKANIGNRNAKDDEDEDDDDDNDDVVVKQDSFVTGEQAVAKRSAATAGTAAASTGGSAGSTWALRDQVERPPVFAQLPRGATAKTARQNAASSTKKKKALNPTEEQKVMEQMRLKVQAQYEVMKKKRRGEGFHL